MSILGSLKSLLAPGPRLDPADCATRVRSGQALLVDVREAHEWRGGIAEHAVLLPLSDLRSDRTLWREFLAQVGTREVLVYCASGMRSSLAARVLCDEGFRATNTGGLSAWAEAGWRIVPPRRR